MALALGSNLRRSHTKVPEKQKTEKKASAFITTVPLGGKSDNSRTSKKEWKEKKKEKEKENSDTSSVEISDFESSDDDAPLRLARPSIIVGNLNSASRKHTQNSSAKSRRSSQ